MNREDFEVGMQVECINCGSNSYIKIGEIYTIRRIHDTSVKIEENHGVYFFKRFKPYNKELSIENMPHEYNF